MSRYPYRGDIIQMCSDCDDWIDSILAETIMAGEVADTDLFIEFMVKETWARGCFLRGGYNG